MVLTPGFTLNNYLNYIIGVNPTLLINAIWSNSQAHMKIYGLNCGFCHLIFGLWLQFWGLAFLYRGNYSPLALAYSAKNSDCT